MDAKKAAEKAKRHAEERARMAEKVFEEASNYEFVDISEAASDED